MVDIIVNRTQHLAYSRRAFWEIDDVGYHDFFIFIARGGFTRGVASNVVVAASRRSLGVGGATILRGFDRLLADCYPSMTTEPSSSPSKPSKSLFSLVIASGELPVAIPIVAVSRPMRSATMAVVCDVFAC